ncbi:UNVERIFIED_CONTAM: hypothetical protein K2H54_066742 [Gekko kuhli]
MRGVASGPGRETAEQQPGEAVQLDPGEVSLEFAFESSKANKGPGGSAQEAQTQALLEKDPQRKAKDLQELWDNLVWRKMSSNS